MSADSASSPARSMDGQAKRRRRRKKNASEKETGDDLVAEEAEWVQTLGMKRTLTYEVVVCAGRRRVLALKGGTGEERN